MKIRCLYFYLFIFSHNRVCTKHCKNDVTYKSDDGVSIDVEFGLFVVEFAFLVSL